MDVRSSSTGPETSSESPPAARRLPWPLLGLHWLIIVNFAVEIIYGARMVFFDLTPGVIGPLGSAAKDVPIELMVTRRLYALETWIAIAGLSLYLGVVEILPRRLRGR